MERATRGRSPMNKFFREFKIVKGKKRMGNAEWARYVRDNPDWRGIHTKFINAQYKMAQDFIKRLAKTKKGQEKIVKLYKIKNIKGYSKLLNKL